MSVTAMSTLKMRKLNTHDVQVFVIATNHSLSVLSEAQMKRSLHLACDSDLHERLRGGR